MTALTKICTKCGKEKSLSGFCDKSKSKDGKNTQCRICIKAYQKENKIKIKTYNRKYRKKNKKKIAILSLEYYENNKETIMAYAKIYYKTYSKEYYKKNKNRLKNNSKQWRENNKSYISYKAKQWRENNKKRIKEYYQINKNSEKFIKTQTNIRKQHSHDLTDLYIKMLLTNRSTLNHQNIPLELIELKRAEIKLKRLIKEKSDG